jgi:hypothetical protein
MERAVGANRACCFNSLVPFAPSSLVSVRQPHASSSLCCAAPVPCSGGPSTSARQRQPVVCPAYAPSLSMSSSRPSLDPQSARTSLDPQQKEWDQAWEAGRLITVKSPEQFEALLQTHSEKLVVLMCKSHACRPCKMFTRKYLSIVSLLLPYMQQPWGSGSITQAVHVVATLPQRTMWHTAVAQHQNGTRCCSDTSTAAITWTICRADSRPLPSLLTCMHALVPLCCTGPALP